LLRAFWKFWTTPVRAEPLAALRISIGLIVLVDTGVSLLPWAADWFGSEGLYPAESFGAYVRGLWRWSLIPADASVPLLQALLGLLMTCAAMSMLGLFTRVATVGMWVLLVSFHMRNPIILNGGDVLLRSATFLLMLMPAGAAWSLDNAIRRRLMHPVQPGLGRKLAALPFTHAVLWHEVMRGEPPAGLVRPWSLRLAQIQLAVLYFFTGVDKLRGIDPGGGYFGDWLGGHAVYRALNHGTISRFAVFGDWPWWVFAPATWLTLGWEITFPLLVLWRRTRWYALSFGVLLHLGIWVTMEVTHFSFTTLAFYWLFVPAVILMDVAGKGAGSDERRRYTLFYDGMCPICKKSRRMVERLDWLKRFEYADVHDREYAERELPEVTYADMLKQMYVKRPDGSYFGGYDAFRAMAPVLPLCWPLAPFMWLPGAKFFGTRIYKWVARNRYKYAKCDDEFCSLHLKLLAGKEVDDEVVAKVVELHRKYKGATKEPKPIA
jgi:predicted DCC family thiol-disulfide oxidoreductase YuxK